MVVMPTDPRAHLKSRNTTFPPVPKRGRVKSQIFESFAKTVVSITSKAGGARKRTGGEGGGDNGSSSTATPTPPLSPFNSKTNTEFL
uniref:Uncharacterized protein n=1 Tax=Manihot esculenta TaxID=3983 RepID=A0A2C9V166_MANES